MPKLKYEDLLEESTSSNVYIIENANFISKADGLINGNVIGINKKIRTRRKRACVPAEEPGHDHTTTGDIINQPYQTTGRSFMPEFGHITN